MSYLSSSMAGLTNVVPVRVIFAPRATLKQGAKLLAIVAILAMPALVAGGEKVDSQVELSGELYSGDFRPSKVPSAQWVNGVLNVALATESGLMFQITGIPADGGIRSGDYGGDQFRLLLLHLPGIRGAATSDGFEEESRLTIRRVDGGRVRLTAKGVCEANGKKVRVDAKLLFPPPQHLGWLEEDTESPGVTEGPE